MNAILYKYATDKKRINQWSIEVKGDCYRTISGFYGMTLTTTAWTCCKPKNIGKSNGTTGAEQAIAEAQSLYNKRIEKGYVDDIKKLGKNKIHFEPMLAKKWEDEKSRVRLPVYSQPKLDGIRCIATYEGLWSRNGKPILSVPHIIEALKPIFDVNPTLILDGELYADKLANDFNKIISLVRKTKPTKEDLVESAKVIEYHIYDIPTSAWGGKPSLNMNFSARFIEGQKQIQLPSCCKWVETIKISPNHMDNNKDFDIMLQYSDYISRGYEGQMIRIDGPYENKRSRFLLKQKEFEEAEFIIQGVIEGKGNLAGKVGKLVFDTFDAAVNAPWEELEALWKAKDTLIGKEATVRYFKETGDGSLRFPKVLQIDRWSYE